MIYTVAWRALPGKSVIRTETYTDLDEAKDQARMAIIAGGPAEVETTVTDSDGVQHYLGVASRA